ncbi:MAG TPA: PQQ-binding-like beta-propeller repeat protein [Candidatus Polarisedimenticolia bacterium]|nr:PQQ-binding-like beta-propeller repeat protein [Candidatus Polarisedimenticolia bacterium]
MRSRRFRIPLRRLLLSSSAVLVLSIPCAGAEWARWRGPEQNGVSGQTGLISSWSVEGENVLWKADFIGRSTPIAFDGRVCAIGRRGEGAAKQEVVSCWDAATGALRWEHRFNVYHTAVPFTRVGWATIEGDTETGHLYAHGVGGLFFCLDRDGKVVWSRSLTEELGRISGYGGRTHSPIVDQDKVILGFSNSGWGDQAVPRHRYFAFDKLTGTLLWVATPGGRPETITTQATPVVAEIGGQRLLIAPNADGWIHALRAADGQKVWSFQLSKQGLNTSVVVDGTRVYATSADENIDEPAMGRVVCIDGTGKGDVTRTHEIWRANEVGVGFASPLLHGGRLYVVDDSANLFALDAATGATLWQHNLGTVGKGSPVWADGKIYAPEVNGHLVILRPEADRAVELDRDQVTMPDGRYAEIYASPAVAYGRVFLATEAGLFCLGKKDAPRPSPAPRTASAKQAEAPPAGPAATLQIVPAEVIAAPGETVAFTARSFDASGLPAAGPVKGEWGLQGLPGSMSADGKLVLSPGGSGMKSGTVTLKAGSLSAEARVRLAPPLPWSEDFETLEAGRSPAGWVGGATRFQGADREGKKVLLKPFMDQGIERSSLFIGPPSMSGYTIQADLLGSVKGRKRPDMGVIAAGYTLDLMGNHQRLQVRDWIEPRLEKTVDFPWDPGVWYTMKLRVERQGSEVVILGKVWPAGNPEPAGWTIRAADAMPILRGSPGLYGYSAADIFYDNVKVTVNE